MTMSTPMSREAKGLLAKTIRDLRGRLLADLAESLRGKEASAAKQERAGFEDRPRKEVVELAANRLLNRLVYLRLLEAAGLREPMVLTGGWRSPGYRDFRERSPGPAEDDDEAYARLLRIVFDELAIDLPGLYGRRGLAESIRVPHATLRHVVEQLDREELASCWTDDMTLGWVCQYWNDPEREALDEAVKNRHKIQRHEIASKTQMFTDRYMVDWLLQNSLGPMWLAICKKQGWTPLVEQHGTLARLEQRRVAWRSKREAGEVSLTQMLPLDDDEERRWAYYVPQPISPGVVEHAPASVREIKLLDPAVGAGHFLVVAFDLLVALYHEEATHRGETWSEIDIAESIVANNLHGIDVDPRAVQIAAAALWLAMRTVARDACPPRLNLVASNLQLGSLERDDAALVELRGEIERKTGIAENVTNTLVAALAEADHLGTLLNVEGAFERASQGTTKRALVQPFERFLAARTCSDDLGLRLRGDQLASGVRFIRMMQESSYDIVVVNPPYHSASKLAPDAVTFQKLYPQERADLFAAFIRRSLELSRPMGISASVTLSNWMFLRTFAGFRAWLLGEHELLMIGDVGKGAFSAGSNLISASMQVFRNTPPTGAGVVALRASATGDSSATADKPWRNAASLICHAGCQGFDPAGSRVVPEWPLVYWWDPERLEDYRRLPLLRDLAATATAQSTGNNARYRRNIWEISAGASGLSPRCRWHPYVGGADGAAWFEPQRTVVNWCWTGIEIKLDKSVQQDRDAFRLASEDLFGKVGIAFAKIGTAFSARKFRQPSIFGDAAPSVFPRDPDVLLCALNSTYSKGVLQDLNPTVNFGIDDAERLPIRRVHGAREIIATLEAAFDVHESHREPSVDFVAPGASPWRHAQAWAQLAVDRAEGTPVPRYEEMLDPEPATDHLSFALGVALGRFGAAALSTKPGVLDPKSDDLAHALPDGTLFVDGTLEPDVLTDSLGHPACALLRETWERHRPPNAKRSLRDWLRLEFFGVHKATYENRPIHWPLSSKHKTYVAWINIHRWNGGTLHRLLAKHLNPTKRRLEGQLTELRAAAESGGSKAIRAVHEQCQELAQFIADVSECAERGPASADPKQARTSAPYDPDLDDGVMINASALWPLLLPQWKQPQKWWTELCTAQGRKDYDWSKLAGRYFPRRVDAKCRVDPSLAVAHGCFWKYHPARAYAWELRLQATIGPDFCIDEEWGEPHDGVSDSRAAFAKFTSERPEEAEELVCKEMKRRAPKPIS